MSRPPEHICTSDVERKKARTNGHSNLRPQSAGGYRYRHWRADKMDSQERSFSGLPVELLIRIGEELAGPDILHAMMACKDWRRDLRLSVRSINICVPRRRTQAFERGISALHGLDLKHVHLYGVASLPEELFRGLHPSIGMFPDVGRELLEIPTVFRSLRSLELAQVQLGTEDLRTLSSLENLKSLQIYRGMLVRREGSDAFPFRQIPSLEALRLRCVEAHERPYSHAQSAILSPVPLSISLPSALTDLDVTECVTGPDFLASTPASIKSSLRRLRFPMPVDLIGALGLEARGRIMHLFRNQLAGFSGLSELEIEVVPSVERHVYGFTRFPLRDSDFFQHLQCLTDLSVKLSNRFLQFTSRQPDAVEEVLQAVVHILGSCDDIQSVSLTLPLLPASAPVLDSVFSKGNIEKLNLDIKIGSSVVENVEMLGERLPKLSKLDKLQALRLGIINFQENLFTPEQLKTLDVSSHLCCLSKLQELDLQSWCTPLNLQGPSLPPFVRSLSLQSTQRFVCDNWTRLGKLQSLNLSRSVISASELCALGTLSDLTFLRLCTICFDPQSSTLASERGVALFKGLTSFHLETRSPEFPLDAVLSTAVSLQELKLSVPAEMQDFLTAALPRMAGLRMLDLSRNNWLDNAFLKRLSGLHCLRFLDVCHCPGVTGACLGYLKELLGLRKVVISGVPEGVHDVLDWWDLEEDFPKCDIQCCCQPAKPSCWWSC